MSDNCPVCQTVLTEKVRLDLINRYDCPRCGRFAMSERTKDSLPLLYNDEEGKDKEEKTAILSYAIRKMQKEGSPPTLDNKLIKEILKQSLPSLPEQVDNLIIWFAENTSYGEQVFVQSVPHLSIVGAKTSDGLALVLKYLIDSELLDGQLSSVMGDIGRGFFALSFNGWEYYKELKGNGINKNEEQDAKSSITETQNMIKLFISHSSKDQELVEKLTELVKNALRLSSSEIRCTTIDGYRLPGGAKTNEQLKQEIRDSIAFIGLISSAATDSMYVLFELGARWGSDKHLLPLLASGVSSNILKGPISDLNALRCDSRPQLHQLVQDLADILKIQSEKPAAYQAYIDKILAITPSVDKIPSGSNQVETPLGYKLADVQTRIMKKVAQFGEHDVTVAKIAAIMSISKMEAQYNLDELAHKHKLLDWFGNMDPNMPARYVLSHEGRGFVLRNK